MASQVLRAAAKVTRQVLPASERAASLSGYMLVREKAEKAEVKSTTVKETNDTYISITRDRVDVYGNTKLLGTNYRDLFYYYKGTQGNGTAFTLMNEKGESAHQYDRGNCIIVIGDGISQNNRVQIVTDKPLYIHQR